MREPADKSLLTDVSRLRSYRCTIIVQSSLWSLWRAQDVARKVLDMARAYQRGERRERNKGARLLTMRADHDISDS